MAENEQKAQKAQRTGASERGRESSIKPNFPDEQLNLSRVMSDNFLD